jgi:NAD(P)-dependent dehydrogenase (short-subunit alcohol dehydrogenase family)
MAKKRSLQQPLTGRVALVAGATRGAGRGIARALGEAGATVYCTGRSVTGKPSPYGRPETIDETAAIIKAAGGTAIALRVDHTSENEVKALFRRILHAHKRIDIVVDSVAGEDPLMGQYGFLWQTDLKTADAIFRQGLTSRIITAKRAALAMMPANAASSWKSRKRHDRRRRESDVAGSQNGAESAPAPLGGRARAAWRRCHRHDARLPALGIHAAALRRHRRQLA